MQLTNRAQKDLARLDEQSQVRVRAALRKLADTGEGDVVKLTDVDPREWRLRVGDWRVRFANLTPDQAILILRVLPRGKAHDR